MNRLISRIALLVVLLVSMLAVGPAGGGVPSPNVRAQAEACGTWRSLDEAQAQVEARGETPVANAGYEILSSFEMSEQSNSNLDFPKTLTQILLFDGSDVAVIDPEGSILRIDSGSVQLFVCGDSEVGVQQPGSNEPEQVGAGEYLVSSGSAIFVDAEDSYYLVGLADEATPSASMQTLDFEVVNAIAPNTIQPAGARITIGGSKSRIICSGGSC